MITMGTARNKRGARRRSSSPRVGNKEGHFNQGVWEEKEAETIRKSALIQCCGIRIKLHVVQGLFGGKQSTVVFLKPLIQRAASTKNHRFDQPLQRAAEDYPVEPRTL